MIWSWGDKREKKFTLIIGPCVGIGDPFWGDCDDIDTRGLNAVMLCETPSAKMNCSRNSMLVRPLADYPHLITIISARVKINPQQKHTEKKIQNKRKLARVLMDHEGWWRGVRKDSFANRDAVKGKKNRKNRIKSKVSFAIVLRMEWVGECESPSKCLMSTWSGNAIILGLQKPI